MEMNRLDSRLGRYTPSSTGPGTNSTRGCVDPRARLDAVNRRKITCHCLESNPDSSTVQPAVLCTPTALNTNPPLKC